MNMAKPNKKSFRFNTSSSNFCPTLCLCEPTLSLHSESSLSTECSLALEPGMPLEAYSANALHISKA